MKCKNCNRKADTGLAHLGPLCKGCFCKTVEKRIRRYVRINKIFKKNDRILIDDRLCLFLIKSIIKDLPVNIFFRKNADKRFIIRNKINKVVVPWTVDDEISLFLEGVFSGRIERGLLKGKGKEIKLLKNITDKEAVLFARFKGIEFKANKKKEDIAEFLNELESKYPETRFSLMKSVEELEGINKAL